MTLTVLNTTEQALEKFKHKPEKRDCYTEKEWYFKYMSFDEGFRYSMQNCLYESVLEIIIEVCGCIPSFANFRLKGLDGVAVCRGADLNCARSWMNDFGNPNATRPDGKSYDLTKAHTNDSTDPNATMICRQRCESQEQMLMSTSSSYPNRQTFPYRDDFCLIMKKVIRVCNDTDRKKAFANRYQSSISCEELLKAYTGESKMCQEDYADVQDIKNNEKIVNFIHEYAEKNIAVVKLFIRDPYYTNIKRDVEITTTSFLGNAGGLMGLCMGFSLVSAFEGVYHIFNSFMKCCASK